VPRCFKPEDAKAAFLIEERDPLNQAGDALGVGAAFWGGGIHLMAFILPSPVELAARK
jgi:hypothetical protein